MTENKEHYLELGRLASDHKLLDNIVFLCSFSDEDKIYLLKNSTCLLYTPSNEHFGIVPIEAMFMKLPVIACASGGPLETVDHEVKVFQLILETDVIKDKNNPGCGRIFSNN